LTELLIGCGNSREKQLRLEGGVGWSELVTLDVDPACKPDVVHDLDVLPYPFADDTFDEIHAYEVLEHTGRQGDWRFFFAQWAEFHRILKPAGYVMGSVPHPTSVWAWGDPSHTRVIPIESLAFLSQRFYSQVGHTASSDFRAVWKGNFEVCYREVTPDLRQLFVLQKRHYPAPI
jgi:SAM-dependent methyltransferase